MGANLEIFFRVILMKATVARNIMMTMLIMELIVLLMRKMETCSGEKWPGWQGTNPLHGRYPFAVYFMFEFT